MPDLFCFMVLKILSDSVSILSLQTKIKLFDVLLMTLVHVSIPIDLTAVASISFGNDHYQ